MSKKTGLVGPPYAEVRQCLACGNDRMETVLELGTMALSGVFPRNPDAPITSGPLDLVRCFSDGGREACGLVQLRQMYRVDELYGDNYGYRSSLNRSMVDHLGRTARGLSRLAGLRRGDIVVDIGSNDGTLLSLYEVEGLTLVGIDPTAAKFRQYYRGDIQVIPDFFSKEQFRARFGDHRAKLVTSIAMFYDLERPLAFMEDIRDILDDDGVWHFEQSYLPLMLRQNAYDTVCHEHLEYYALRQIQWMAERAGLRLVDVSLNDINGGSCAVTAVRSTSAYRSASPELERLLRQEQEMGLDSPEIYESFRRRIEEHRTQLLELLGRMHGAGETVLGYGASTKGNTILQYCRITPRLLPAIAEVNADKFGRFTPGTGIPIISEEQARRMNPRYFFVLPWHFRMNLLSREEAFLKAGGKMVFPLPRLEIVSG